MSSLGIFNKETKTYQKVAYLSKTAVIDEATNNRVTITADGLDRLADDWHSTRKLY